MAFGNYPAGNGVVSCNATKATPTLVADLLGDWREEVVFGTTNADSLIVFTTTTPTPHRLYTLMHDPVYRAAVAWQNSAYNQPPHPGFLLADKAKWLVPSIALVNAPAGVVNNAPVFATGKTLSIPENTATVVMCAATDADGDAVTWAIAGGEDSARFSIDKSNGALAFKAAPDHEKSVDNGADNIYKVTVAASDGKASTTLAISVLVTDVTDENSSSVRRSIDQVWANVTWIDVRGQVVAAGEQWIDPDAPRPVAPAGLRGLAIAEIAVAGMPMRSVRVVVPGR